ncbi:hypothetical protein JCGZ_09674 [Jatropha curcas]|uniref:Seed maturation-like protein n=1 Tax=Jatropha curcas TaxID=180498 RepID=A0A067LL20_JATCU|nr:uncharacterized protein LOC105642268 [Jatropha curcas]KDP45425.1 hypothetical protein JCGZ_09674 [Jatropha curcas]
MAATARAFILSRISDLSYKPQPKPPPPALLSRHNFFQRRSSSFSSSAVATVSCLSSGGEVSDDFVSTRKSNFDRGFSVIANMLKRIEPLDTSVISKGVSDSAKDSMKQTISTMLGLLPSDQFSVNIRVSKHPLDRLLISAIITGYTLWNAEYRISLMRNLDISVETSKKSNCQKEKEELREVSEDNESGVGEIGIQDLEISPQVFGDLSPEALSYIQKLQSELSSMERELNDWKKETMQIECNRGSRNDLLEYLRSLDPEMVSELSRPSSVEVGDIIHQLVQNILRRFFKDDPSNFMDDSAVTNPESHKDGEFCDTMGTSRDYLAKLLFWCMLLGHHLRGLENRLHLSCVVGLL